MKQLAIISGKGGTGKTTVTTALAFWAQDKVMVDCDVDAANLHLSLHPQVLYTKDFYSGKKAQVDSQVCTGCSRCVQVCRFDAINERYQIDHLSCTGCGACGLVCPVEAIELKDNLAGQWFVSNTIYGPLVHARLGIAEDNSGKLVTQVRAKAKEIAEEKGYQLIIIDGPPGIGCPVIASITGVDLVLAVTEPTQSGLHDLERVITVAGNFGIPCMVCINKFDLNPVLTAEIETVCRQRSVGLAGRIPFDRKVVEAMVTGRDFAEQLPTITYNCLKKIWENVHETMLGMSGVHSSTYELDDPLEPGLI